MLSCNTILGIISVCQGCHNKIPQAGWLEKQRFIFPHGSGGCKSGIQVLAGLVSPEASLLSFQMATFSVSSHVCMCLCLHWASYKATCHTKIGPHPYDFI